MENLAIAALSLSIVALCFALISANRELREIKNLLKEFLSKEDDVKHLDKSVEN